LVCRKTTNKMLTSPLSKTSSLKKVVGQKTQQRRKINYFFILCILTNRNNPSVVGVTQTIKKNTLSSIEMHC
ncbi:MAG: hypothetical protein ACOVO1_02375, partial [Chitinophagaceae bacterium]